MSSHAEPFRYAQLIESPVSWRIQPMQIDTKNRDGSMAEPGMPFKAGPAPRNSKAPVVGPDAVYSGLLECPCTDRITRSYGNIEFSRLGPFLAPFSQPYATPQRAV